MGYYWRVPWLQPREIRRNGTSNFAEGKVQALICSVDTLSIWSVFKLYILNVSKGRGPEPPSTCRNKSLSPLCFERGHLWSMLPFLPQFGGSSIRNLFRLLVKESDPFPGSTWLKYKVMGIFFPLFPLSLMGLVFFSFSF